jgi:hypothetical protein
MAMNKPKPKKPNSNVPRQTNLAATKSTFKCTEGALEPYRCRHCNFTSHVLVELKRHMKQIHQQKSNTDQIVILQGCNNCKFETYSCLLLTNHLWKKCAKIRTAKCCKSIKTCNQEKLKVHLFPENPPEMWMQCGQCIYRTTRLFDLSRHVKLKHVDDFKFRWFQCEHCSYQAKQQSHLKTHTQRKHPINDTIKWFYCKECLYKSQRKASLTTHVQIKHKMGVDMLYRCDKCIFKSKFKFNLNMHVQAVHL